ncbi:MAG: amidohydrolase [Alphaproteobacteria bacterium]|nr:amidohydrolase [Alphaproteobacteria bacterium]
MSAMQIVSADSHIVEPLDMWSKVLGDRWGDRIPHVLKRHNGQDGHFLVTGKQVLKLPEKGGAVAEAHRDLYEAGFLPDKRVEFQKRAKITAETLYGSHMLIILQSPHRDALRASCEVFNDWLADYCAYDSKRLIGVGMVPIDDVAWGIREMERIVKKGLKGLCINVALAPELAPYRDRRYDPFWARAQEMNVPITLHSITGNIIDPFYPRNPREGEEAAGTLLGLYTEALATLANDFVFGGILDRFPRLKLIVSEFEIWWLPFFRFKTDQMTTTLSKKMNLPPLKKKPSEYWGSQIWAGVIGDPTLEDVVKRVGPETVLWGSDFPHVRSIGLDTHEVLARTFKDFSETDRERLVGGNIKHIYGLQ